jgi:hypothetical protein
MFRLTLWCVGVISGAMLVSGPAWPLAGQVTEGVASLTLQDPPRWRMQTGDRFEVQLDQSLETRTECQTLERTTQNRTVLDLEWVVVDVREQKFLIEQTLRRVQINVDLPTEDGARLILDTAAANAKARKGVEAEVLRDLTALIGLQVQVLMSERGEILEVQLADAARTKIEKLGSALPVVDMLTPAGLNELFRQSLFVLPEQPLEAAPPWQVTRETTGPWGAVKLQTDLKFEGEVELNRERFWKFSAVDSATTTPLDPAKSRPGDPPPQLVDLTGNTTYWFDPRSAVFRRAEASSRVLSEKIYRDLKITTEIKGTSVMVINLAR